QRDFLWNAQSRFGRWATVAAEAPVACPRYCGDNAIRAHPADTVPSGVCYVEPAIRAHSDAFRLEQFCLSSRTAVAAITKRPRPCHGSYDLTDIKPSGPPGAPVSEVERLGCRVVSMMDVQAPTSQASTTGIQTADDGSQLLEERELDRKS